MNGIKGLGASRAVSRAASKAELIDSFRAKNTQTKPFLANRDICLITLRIGLATTMYRSWGKHSE